GSGRQRHVNNLVISVFFFQAEDGIRDRNVTGVQTCALPISLRSRGPIGPALRRCRVCPSWSRSSGSPIRTATVAITSPAYPVMRSEERRVGKACRYEGSR